MDSYEPFMKSPSSTVDIDDVDDDWNDDEEIELGSEEHDLFLKDSYIKPSGNNVLPFRATSPSAIAVASQQQLPQASSTSNHRLSRNHRSLNHQQSAASLDGLLDDTSGGCDFTETNDIPLNGMSQNHQKDGNFTKNEASLRMHDSGRGSPSSSSIVYQVPNFDQFAGNLAPSSPSSTLVSMIIIIVILSVTIVPKVFSPMSKSDDTNSNGKSVINNSSAQQQMEQHSDFRCKCICPPPHRLNLNESLSDASPATNSTTNNHNKNNNHGNSTISTGNKIVEVANKEGDKSNTITSKTKLEHHNHDKVTNVTTKTQQVNHMMRRLYVGNTTPTQCNCNNIVQPHLKDDRISLKEFCGHCECRYQSRNTTTIRRNVIFFIAVLTGLTLYMLIQYFLKYFRITRRSLPKHLKWLSHQVTEG